MDKLSIKITILNIKKLIFFYKLIQIFYLNNMKITLLINYFFDSIAKDFF